MRHSSAISVLSAIGGALATNQVMPMVDVSSSTIAAAMAETTMVHVMPSSSIMSHPALMQTSAAHVMVSATQTTSAPAMVHTTVPAAAVVTTNTAGYLASMASPSAAAGPMTHTVIVGGAAGLVYTPSQVMAGINDVVHFVFMSQNHTVTQSTFDKPCNKMAADAFDSNFMPNPNNTMSPAPTFKYTVTAKEPTWWYCKQRTGNHCGKGMVFAINPTAEKSFDIFKAAAIKINGTVASTTAAAATVSAVSSTVTLVAGGETAAGVTTSANAGAVATKTAAAPIVTGWNQGASGATCNCACFCGVGAYPAGDGIGAYGGMGGSLPAPW
ncbi:hypothetical protein L873DRAFT_1306808 [Choiromyces venosus 120613-1]|uniref:Cupredoxin n=1 Tax=Choiromyces venosus 120613-1 TaxID=1336337 RepID=A0A3N4JBB3_9PEZI|nr:hypothetical protein L873DRAFT_1306808 [Choiromyces venosus 120613-1]